MFYWIYDIPTATLVFLLSAIAIAVAWSGTIFLRPFLRLFVGRQAGVNDVVGYLLGAHGVYFGILLGLLAVSAYQNYTTADGIVQQEASKLAALYRDVSPYAQPARQECKPSFGPTRGTSSTKPGRCSSKD
jgi:hypothetical protein